MTDNQQPATKQPAAETKRPPNTPNKVATPRLFNAVEDIVKEAGLDPDSSIGDLYDAFEKAIVRQVRGL